MNQNMTLQIEYEFIRSVFFPRWDKKRQWQVKEVWDLPSEGRCETDRKRIFIRPQPESSKEMLHLLLIHEICHAITPNHGEKWRRRLLKAADCAKGLGMLALSEVIQQEADVYYQDKKILASEIYQQIRCMVQQSTQTSYGSVIRYLALEHGLYRNEIIKKYSLCKQTYDRAMQAHRKTHPSE